MKRAASSDESLSFLPPARRRVLLHGFVGGGCGDKASFDSEFGGAVQERHRERSVDALAFDGEIGDNMSGAVGGGAPAEHCSGLGVESADERECFLKG